MTDDNYVSTNASMSVLTDSTYTDDIMTDDIQMRTIGKPKPDKDPNALKLASFRTKEGIWAEFCQKAESINLTATDVLKAAMDQFIAGEYDPRVYVPSRHNDSGMTRNDVIDIVNTAISTLSTQNDSVLTRDDVMTIVNEYIDSHKASEPNAITELVKAEIEPLADLLTELETYAQNQFKAVREELKKPLAIVR
jgi:DNA-binding protein Fis